MIYNYRNLIASLPLFLVTLFASAAYAQIPAQYATLAPAQAKAQVAQWEAQYGAPGARFDFREKIAQDGTVSLGFNWACPVMRTVETGFITVEARADRTEKAKGLQTYKGQINAMCAPGGVGIIEFSDGVRWIGGIFAHGAYSAAGTDYLPRPSGLGAFVSPDGTRRYLIVTADTSAVWGYKVERTIFEEGPGAAPRITGSASTNAGASAANYKAGETIRDCDKCPEMVVVPAGSFMMGSPATEEGRGNDEGPRHAIAFAAPFAVGKFEVTFEEYDACVAASACTAVRDSWGRGKRPATSISYEDANAYVGWLAKTTGQKYFLLSEAEWEYAARAGSDTPWNTGEAIITDDANYLNIFGEAIPVGTFAPNAFGLYDMHGNVWEWTLDCYEKGYFGAEKTGGPRVAEGCMKHVIRGGSYGNEPNDLRSARRYPYEGTADRSIGFRVTRAL